MPKPKPKPQARGLADGLRAERRACKLAMVEVAAKLHWSESTLSRIETGQRNASSEETAALLAIYQVTGARRDNLLELARDVDRPAWLELRHGEASEQAGLLARYEAEAVTIVETTVSTIPELLRTPAYVRSSRMPARVTPERQKVFTGKRPPKLLAYFDEAALHRVIGGPKIMADQLRHVAVLTERAPVEVRVIPWGVGAHAALNGAFELLDFADARPLVYLEQLGSGLFLDRGADVAPYLRAVTTLDSVALAPAKSVQLIEHLAERYESVVESGPQRGDLLGHQPRLAGQHGDVPVAR